jgi:hypothetical protein
MCFDDLMWKHHTMKVEVLHNDSWCFIQWKLQLYKMFMYRYGYNFGASVEGWES